MAIAIRTRMLLAMVVVGAVLSPGRPVLAVDCTAKQAEPAIDANGRLQWGDASLPAEDRRRIEDLFSRYAWALDERNAGMFAALFAESGSYEVCSGGGTIQILFAPSNELENTMQRLFEETAMAFQPRHILSNTLLRGSASDDSILSKTTMLTLIQRVEGDRVLPEPDYTADVRGTLTRDEDGNWKFLSLIVYADTPVFEPMGR